MLRYVIHTTFTLCMVLLASVAFSQQIKWKEKSSGIVGEKKQSIEQLPASESKSDSLVVASKKRLQVPSMKKSADSSQSKLASFSKRDSLTSQGQGMQRNITEKVNKWNDRVKGGTTDEGIASSGKIQKQTNLTLLKTDTTRLDSLADLSTSFQNVGSEADRTVHKVNDEMGQSSDFFEEVTGQSSGLSPIEMPASPGSADRSVIPVEEGLGTLPVLNPSKDLDLGAGMKEDTGPLNKIDGIGKNGPELGGSGMEIPGMEVPGMEVPDRGISGPEDMELGESVSDMGKISDEIGNPGSLKEQELPPVEVDGSEITLAGKNSDLKKLKEKKQELSLDNVDSSKYVPVDKLVQKEEFKKVKTLKEEASGVKKHQKKLKNLEEADADELEESVAERMEKLSDGKLEQHQKFMKAWEHQRNDNISKFETFNDAESLKGAIQSEGKRLAVDHFGEHQAVLIASHDQLQKVKRKDDYIPSVKAYKAGDREQRVSSEPWINRIIFGFHFQLGKVDTLRAFDIEPYVSWKLTDKIKISGAYFFRNTVQFDSGIQLRRAFIRGFRGSVSYDLVKKFAAIISVDRLVVQRAGEQTERTRETRLLAGIHKPYFIKGWWNGDIQLFYHLNHRYEDSYDGPLHIRIGFFLDPKHKSQKKRK